MDWKIGTLAPAAALAALLAAPAARAQADGIAIVDAPAVAVDGGFSNIVVSVSDELDVSTVTLWYSVADTGGYFTPSNENFIVMSPTGSEREYSCAIPILPEGTMTWHVEVVCTDGAVKRTSDQTTATSKALDYDRFHDMKGITGIATASGDYYDANYGWVQDTTVLGNMSSNFYANAPGGSEWRASGVAWTYADRSRVPNISSRQNTNPSQYPVLAFMNLPPSAKPFIRTPRLEDGVGTISFAARNVAGSNNRVAVQVTRSESPGEGDWRTVGEEWVFSTGGTTYHCTNVVNDASVTYVRLLRTSENAGNPILAGGWIGIDDIRVSYPTPDVTLRERLRNPGYPAIGQDIEVRCLVSNKYARIPAINKRASLLYAVTENESDVVPEDAWTPLGMGYSCETNGCSLYAAAMPAQGRPAWLHYCFRCDFDGYYFTSPAANGLVPRVFGPYAVRVSAGVPAVRMRGWRRDAAAEAD